MKMIRVIKKLFAPKWKVGRCGWPYPEGYCTYRKILGRTTILDTGLTKEEALETCKQLNQ